jgi:aminoglycoside phosphotransferase (APT) family kinase protein
MTIVYQNPDVTFTYYLLIPHPHEFRLLLAKEGKRWTLPFFCPEEHHFGVVAHINQHVWQGLGLYVATLRCVLTDYDETVGERRFYALDNLDANWQPPEGMIWASEADIRNLPLTDGLQREAIERHFQWWHSHSSLRAPWMRPGWFAKAADWLVDVADRMNIGGMMSVVQRRAWARSSTLQLHADNSTLYLKAVPQMFSYEPVITRVLALRYPGYAPKVKAVHVERGWMLMEDFGGRSLVDCDDLSIWKEGIRQYAQIQLDLVRSTESLIALGLPDRHLDYLASQIERLRHNLPDTLTDEEQRDIWHAASTWRSLCYELADYNIPLSLSHGDLWAGNVIVRETGDCLFFDWSDASVSHPFFDLPFFLLELNPNFSDVKDARQQIQDAYLEMWTRYEPLINLRRAYHLAQVLGFVHQATIYYSHVLPNIESSARWEMESMLPMLLRQALAAYQQFEQTGH